MLIRSAGVFAVLIAMALPAVAAEITGAGAGAKLNGNAMPADELPKALNPGDLVTGPATIDSDGDFLSVSANSVVEVEAGDVEGTVRFFLQKGSVAGTISTTLIRIPVGWIGAVADTTAEFFAETISAGRGFVQANAGEVGVLYGNLYTVNLVEGHGVELWVGAKPEDLCFTTKQNNPGDVTISAAVSDQTVITLRVPKATSGCLEQMPGDQTRITSEPASWKDGRIVIDTRVGETPMKSGSLGPGTFAIINNATGEIQFGFSEVDFAIIERAISLTSEFTALATSNFFGLQ